jgi:filamentous hemagglutinin family protein
MKPQFPLRPLVLAIAAALPLLMGAPAYANPENAQIIHGQADIQQVGKMLTIKNTPNAIIEWQKFNIAKDEATRFQQESAKSIVLNRVSGIDPSQILGQLSSNGRVFLINKNGLLVGKDARIDTAGFVASTLDIKNDDFLNGRYRFDGSGGKIAVEGMIRSQDGDVFLISPDISNSGLIEASNGHVVLAAGQSVEIVSLSLEGLRFTLQAPSDSVINLGQIKGDAVGLFAGTLKHSGEIRAVRAEQVGGKVLLRASDKIETTTSSHITANGAVGGQVTLDAGPSGTLLASGQISATGLKGGDVQLLGKHVGLLDHAIVDASGQNAGGNILLGGDYQGGNALVSNSTASYTSPESTLRADAITEGNGGKVIVWADKTTRVNGGISAKGGALGGDGGLVETSGKEYLDFKARVDTSAVKGWKSGTLLLDPQGISICSTASECTSSLTQSSGLFDHNVTASSNLTTEDINSALASNNVIIQSIAAITFDADLNIATTVSSDKSLTFHAYKDDTSATGGDGIDMSNKTITTASTGSSLWTGDLTLKTDKLGIKTRQITTNGNITLLASDGSVFVNGDLTSGTNKQISISGKSGISQGTAITISSNILSVSTLSSATSGTTIDIGKSAHSVNKISSNTDYALYFKNSKAVEIISHPDLSSKSKLGENSWIETNGSISQSAPLELIGSGSLTLRATTGNINLNNTNNKIGSLSAKTDASGGTITIKNNSTLSLYNNINAQTQIGPSQSGMSTSNGNISLENSENITFGGLEIDTGTGNVDLITTAASKTISIPNSNNTGKISAANINLQADTITLTAAAEVGNNYGNLKAAGGTVNLSPTSNNSATQIGGTSRSGFAFGLTQDELNNITANKLKLGNSSHPVGNISINSVDLNTNNNITTLDLYSSGTISQSGSIKVNGLAARGTSITINNSSNLFNEGIALTASGDINLDYTGNLNIGLSGYADGLASSTDIIARASGNLAINNLISAKNLTLTATSGTINQSAGVITATKLTATSSGALNLEKDNQLDGLSASNSSGDLKIKNSKALSVNSLKSNGNIDLSNTGDTTLNGDITSINSNTITLKSNKLTQGSGIITTNALNISATAAVSLDKDNMISKAAISGSNITLNNNQAITLGIINSGTGDIKITNKGNISLSDTLTANTANINSDGNIDANNSINTTTANFTANNKLILSGKLNTTSATLKGNSLELKGNINTTSAKLNADNNIAISNTFTADQVEITTSKGNIDFSGNFNAKTATLSAVTGGITELSSASITSNKLTATAGTGITLENNNKIDNASLKTIKGNILLSNNKALSLGESSGDQFKLSNTEGLILSGNLNASQIDISASNISDSANASITGNAKLTTTGDIVLNNSSQNLASLAASASGGLMLKNISALSLQEIKAKTIDINNDGKLSIDGVLSSSEGSKLQSASGISINNSITSKNINLNTDQLNMGEQGKIDTADFIYTPNTANTIKVSLGGNSSNNGGLSLTKSDISKIKASKVIIGDEKGNKVGDISIQGFNADGVDLFINSAGALSQSAGGTITAKLLNTQATSINLGEANTVDTFIPNSTGDIVFSNTKTLALGPIKTNGLLKIDTQGSLGLNDAISAKSISLKASGGEIKSLANGTLSADSLIATASKGITLDNANTLNQASLISTEGDISLNNSKALTLGKVSSNGNLRLSTAGDLKLNEDVSANNILLSSSAGLQSAGVISSKILNVKAGTGIRLDAANVLDQVKLISDSGNISLLNSKALILDTTSTSGDIKINNNGNLLIKDNLSGNQVQLKVINANISEADGSRITANTFNAEAEQGITLQSNSNSIATAQLASKGDISLNNSKSIELLSVTSAAGIDINAVGTLKINDQLQGTAINLKASDVIDSASSKINTNKLQIESQGVISLDKGANAISQLSAKSSGAISINNNADLVLQTINTNGNVLIDNQGTLTVSAPFSADDTALSSKGALRINSGSFKSTGTIRLNSRDTGANNDNIIQDTHLIAAGDIKINANDSYIQNADLIAGASATQLNQGTSAGARLGATAQGVVGTTGEISVDATVIQVAPGVKAVSANGGAISYGSTRTISNNITADQIKTTGVVNKVGKNIDPNPVTSPVINIKNILNKLPDSTTQEQVDKLVKVIVIQKQDQQTHFQLIGTGQLPFEAQKPTEIEPPKETIRIAGEDDANCP